MRKENSVIREFAFINEREESHGDEWMNACESIDDRRHMGGVACESEGDPERERVFSEDLVCIWKNHGQQSGMRWSSKSTQ